MEGLQAQFWSMVASLAAAASTFLAAVVALWLGYRTGRVRLKVKLQVYRREGSREPHAIIWSVTNTGDRRVTIQQVGFRTRKPPVGDEDHAMPKNQPPCLPQVLLPGDHATLQMPWRRSTMAELASSRPYKAYVSTGGKHVYAGMGAWLRAFFREARQFGDEPA